MSTPYFIYILFSATADKYYVGYTSDYLKRLEDHNHQEFFNTYTSKFRPWVIAAVFQVGDDESVAVKLERFIKKQKNRRLIEQLVNPDYFSSGALAQLVIPHRQETRAKLIRGSLVQRLYRESGGQ